MNYIFFGSDNFSELVLKILKNNNFIPQSVIDGKKEIKELKDKIRELKPDLFIIASFGKILPKELIYLPKKGTLVLHPSLLPEFRGPSPIETALLKGKTITGNTVILADEKVDHGPVLAQEEIEIKKEDDYESLAKKLGEKGGELLARTIPLWLGNKIESKEQDHSRATYTKLFVKEDGEIDWSRDSEEILNQIRALNPWPSVYTFWFDGKNNKKRLIVLKAKKSFYKSEKELKSGAIVFKNNSLLVKTGDDFLELLEIKPEGKNPMSGEAFWRGHQSTLIFIF